MKKFEGSFESSSDVRIVGGRDKLLFSNKEFRLLAGHDYPVNLMTDSVLNLMCK